MASDDRQRCRFPDTGRLLGVDYGTVRIGLAVCDPDRRLASPLELYQRRDAERDADYLRQVVRREHVVGLVVGLPVYPSGDESEKSLEARRFGAWLAGLTGLPVVFVDERYTSNEAERLLGGARMTRAQRKRRKDMLAAQLILSAYLESPHTAAQSPESLEG